MRIFIAALLLGCGPQATPPSAGPPAEYEAGERVFEELRSIPVIMVSQNETGEAMLLELETSLIEYGGRGDQALAHYSAVEAQPWRMRALVRAVEVYVFSAEVVKESRIMLPRDLRGQMADEPERAEALEQDFRNTIQTVLLQTTQRLRCRGQTILEEYLPVRTEGADQDDVQRALELRAELTGACGDATGERTRLHIQE